MAERFLCSVGEDSALSNYYIERLRIKLKIKAGKLRHNFVILAELTPAKWCFRFDDRIIGIFRPRIGFGVDKQHKIQISNGYDEALTGS